MGCNFFATEPSYPPCTCTATCETGISMCPQSITYTIPMVGGCFKAQELTQYEAWEELRKGLKGGRKKSTSQNFAFIPTGGVLSVSDKHGAEPLLLLQQIEPWKHICTPCLQAARRV